jgi:sec-independent protein translocase protein TatA
MPFSLGPTEMIFIMVVLLRIFGAKRLPELGSGLGKGIREFKRSMKDINAEIDRVGEEDNQISSPRQRHAVPPAREAAAPAREREKESSDLG